MHEQLQFTHQNRTQNRSKILDGTFCSNKSTSLSQLFSQTHRKYLTSAWVHLFIYVRETKESQKYQRRIQNPLKHPRCSYP